jgi:hypothetical protein
MVVYFWIQIMIERLRASLATTATFLKEAYSDNGAPSSSRIHTGALVLSVIIWLTVLVLHNHDLPDAVKIGAIAALIGAPYAINRFSQKSDNDDKKV